MKVSKLELEYFFQKVQKQNEKIIQEYYEGKTSRNNFLRASENSELIKKAEKRLAVTPQF